MPTPTQTANAVSQALTEQLQAVADTAAVIIDQVTEILSEIEHAPA